jgi:MerR family transcriptional regulator, light-induced transcriptional regulator
MLCDLLDCEGWDTTYLGAAVPLDRLRATVLREKPHVVALSAAIATHLPRLEAMVATVRQVAGPSPPLVIVGGRPFLRDPELARRIGADLTADDAVQAVEILTQRFSGS